jgi:CRISP-associated protein Cas1
MQIVLDTYGLNLNVRNGCFVIASSTEKRMVHPSRIDNILVTMPCRLSTPAILLAAKNEIAITICSLAGKPEARLWSSRFLNISTLRRKQYVFSESAKGLEWAAGMIVQKLEGQQSNLNFLADRKPSLLEEVSEAISEIKQLTAKIKLLNYETETSQSKLRYYEAAAAKIYWPLMGKKLPDPFYFETRVKREPTDPFNSSINYLYGMLRNQSEAAVLSLGLDPALGCMHRDGYKLPSLVFDMMEPFRPLMDRLLVEAILNGKMKANMTETDDLGICFLTREGRKMMIELFNGKLHKIMAYRKTRASLLDHILLETRQLINKIEAR